MFKKAEPIIRRILKNINQLKIQNYIILKERAILLRDGIRTKIIQSVLEK